jgi:hypothetical protein
MAGSADASDLTITWRRTRGEIADPRVRMPPTSQFWAMPTNCEWPLTGNRSSHRECLQLAESAQSASTRIDLAAVTAVHKDAIEFPAQYVDKINELLIKSRPQPPQRRSYGPCPRHPVHAGQTQRCVGFWACIPRPSGGLRRDAVPKLWTASLALPGDGG